MANHAEGLNTPCFVYLLQCFEMVIWQHNSEGAHVTSKRFTYKSGILYELHVHLMHTLFALPLCSSHLILNPCQRYKHLKFVTYMFIAEEHMDILLFSGMLIIHSKMHNIKNRYIFRYWKVCYTYINITCYFISYSLSGIFVIIAKTKKSGNI
jgi:hypothetical protein